MKDNASKLHHADFDIHSQLPETDNNDEHDDDTPTPRSPHLAPAASFEPKKGKEMIHHLTALHIFMLVLQWNRCHAKKSSTLLSLNSVWVTQVRKWPVFNYGEATYILNSECIFAYSAPWVPIQERYGSNLQSFTPYSHWFQTNRLLWGNRWKQWGMPRQPTYVLNDTLVGWPFWWIINRECHRSSRSICRNVASMHETCPKQVFKEPCPEGSATSSEACDQADYGLPWGEDFIRERISIPSIAKCVELWWYGTRLR